MSKVFEKKRMRMILPCLLIISISSSLIGCGGRKAIDNYPGMETASSTDDENSEADGSISELNYSDGKVFYMARGQHGENVIKVDAEIIGDPKDTYPVYDIKYWDAKEADLINITTYLIGGRSAELLLPIEIADEDYLVNRLELLKERQDKFMEKGKEVPKSVTKEIEAIQAQLSSPDLNSGVKLSKPDRVHAIDLHDYYEAEYGVDVDLKFCFAENETEDGDIVRLDFITYKGNTSMKYYTADYNYNDSNHYYLAESENLLPVNFDRISASGAEEYSAGLLTRLGFGGFICTNTFPACDYGSFTDVYGEHSYEKPAYCSFFSAEVEGRHRPCNSATDFFSDNMTSTHPVINAENICTIFSGGTEMYVYGEDSVPANDTSTYDSTCVCIGENDKIIEVYATNILDDVQVKTKQAKLLPFEDADACAQKYLTYIAAHDLEGYEKKVNRIELGMCRTIGEKGNLFMVPAWYYLLSTSADNPLQEPLMAVNAIDGSIIDVQAGGTTVTY